MNKLIKLFILVNIFLCPVHCQTRAKAEEEYLLPYGEEPKELHVKSISLEDQPTEFTILCYNYDSLKHLELRRDEFVPKYGIKITFENCFNNETDNGNFMNFSLVNAVTNILPTVTDSSFKWSWFDIALTNMSVVNCDLLFNNFSLTRYKRVFFSNIGCTSSSFLNGLKCKTCDFKNNIEVDFNEFNGDMNDTRNLFINYNKLINFNQNNLQKFSLLNWLTIRHFSLDDYNRFNVSGVFAFNSHLKYLAITDSDQGITLHEDVFQGQRNLEKLNLENLYLEHLPKNVFTDLISLKTLNLKSNNIKTFDSNTFANALNLDLIRLSGNPVFMGPQNETQPFVFGASRKISLSLENFTIHTVDVFENLINNPAIWRIRFNSIVMDSINIADFTRTHIARERVLHVTFKDKNDDVYVNFDYIKSHSIPYRGDKNLNVSIDLPIHNRYCKECFIIKHFLYHQLQDEPYFPLFFEKTGVVVNFAMSCHRPDEFFEETYELNCPVNCVCKHNPLRGRVIIDCSNKNLTEIPVITYPDQYENIEGIDLIFENNSLSLLSVGNQSSQVKERLTTMLFRNNKIMELMIVELWSLPHLEILDLCENPFFESDTYNVIKTTWLNNNSCMLRVIDSWSNSYLLRKINETHLKDQFLNRLTC